MAKMILIMAKMINITYILPQKTSRMMEQNREPLIQGNQFFFYKGIKAVSGEIVVFTVKGAETF